LISRLDSNAKQAQETVSRDIINNRQPSKINSSLTGDTCLRQSTAKGSIIIVHILHWIES